MIISNMDTGLRRFWIFSFLWLFADIHFAVCKTSWDCTFENGLCSWSNFNNTWKIRNNGQEDGFYTDDHAPGSKTGVFLYGGDSSASILTSAVEFQPQSSYCLQFWYRMYGPNVGSLAVKSNQLKDNLFYKDGLQGDGWKLGYLQLPKTQSTPYNITFQVEKLPQRNNYVAIDDISVTLEECKEVFSPGCSFEYGLCGWTAASSGFQISNGNSDLSMNVDADHSLGSMYGSFLMYRYKTGSASVKNSASITSPKLEFTEPICFQFHYFLNDQVTNFSAVIQTKGSYDMHPYTIWTTENFILGKWTKGQILLANPQKSQITVIITAVFQTDTVIALDDFMFSNGTCSHYEHTSFEDGLGSFDNSNGNDFYWFTASQENKPYGIYVPDMDFTLFSRTGHWAVATSLSTNTLGKKAELWSSLIPLHDAHYGCLEFMLFHAGTDAGSLTVTLKNKDLTWGYVVWQFTDTINTAENVAGRVPLNLEFDEEFYIVFTATLGKNGTWGLDEILVNLFAQSCTVLPPRAEVTNLPTKPTAPTTSTKPVVASPFDCMFDNDSCTWSISQEKNSWKVVDTDDQNLQQAGLLRDHTGGLGHFIILQGDERNPIQHSLTSAEIKSSYMCLSFWIYIGGSLTGHVQLYRVIGESSNFLFGSTHNTDGWKKIEVPLKEQRNFKLEFKGYRSSTTMGAVALDDIQVLDRACDVDSVYHCTYDYEDTCGFTQSPQQDTQWSWVSSRMMGTELFLDHTAGTPQGHFMMMTDLSPGKVATLTSPKIPAMSGCLTLWMTLRIGSLRVYIKRDSSLDKELLLQREDFEAAFAEWDKAEVTFSSNSPFSIEIEGETGTQHDSSGFILIDDLNLKDGNCETNGACSFEFDMCTWQDVSSTNNFGYVRSAGSDRYSTWGPASDFTLGSAMGHYLLVPTSVSMGTHVLLASETFPAQLEQCFHFFYSMDGMGLGTLNVFVENENTVAKNLTWTKSRNQGQGWHHGYTSVTLNEPYKVVIEYVKGIATESALALDDFMFTPGLCQGNGQPTQSTQAPSVTTTVAWPTTPFYNVTEFDCDFELGTICDWRLSGNQLTWMVKEGRFFSRPDHTTHTEQGNFLVVSGSSQAFSSTSALFTSPEIPPGDRCLTFAYGMWLNHAFQLSVYLEENFKKTLVFRKDGVDNSDWVGESVNINTKGPFKIIFEAVQTVAESGGVFLDDIKVPKGSCLSQPVTGVQWSCDFESGPSQCGFTRYDDPSIEDYNWIWSQGAGTGLNDHSFGSTYGHFLINHLEASSTPGKDLTIHTISPVFKKPSNGQSMCLEFYYQMKTVAPTNFSVYAVSDVTTKPSPKLKLWSQGYSVDGGWQKKTLDIVMDTDFQIVFETTSGPKTSVYAIDDISLLNHKCPSEALCPFESGLCQWTNGADEFQDVKVYWNLRSGQSLGSSQQGPAVDHTLNNQYGYYISFEGNGAQEGSKAKLYSQEFDPSVQYRCFRFWYHMYGTGVAKVKVFIVNHSKLTNLESEAELWSLYPPSDDKWLEARVPIPDIYTQAPYQINIEGTAYADKTGDFSLDDLSFTKDACTVVPDDAAPLAVPTKTVILDCDFSYITNCNGWHVASNTGFDIHNRTHSAECHTFAGTNMAFTSKKDTQSGEVILNSSTSIPRHLSCYTLTYDMSVTRGYASLDVVQYTNGVETVLYHRALYGEEQIEKAPEACYAVASFNIHSQFDFQLLIKMSFENVSSASFMLYDLTLSATGACYREDICDVETDLCGFSTQPGDMTPWKSVQASSQIPDHSTLGQTGHFFYINTINETVPRPHWLSSSFFPPSGEECLEFWYFIPWSSGKGELQVIVSEKLENNAVNGDVKWRTIKATGNRWRVGRVDISAQRPYQVTFSAATDLESQNFAVAVDDIRFLPSSCRLVPDCDFDLNLCQYQPDVPELWTRITPDHTSGKGYAISTAYFNSSLEDVRRRLSTESLPPTTGAMCLAFWHRMQGQGSLSVIVDKPEKGEQLVGKIYHNELTSTNQWYLKLLNIDKQEKPFSVVFEVENKFGYGVAIDDILSYNGSCSDFKNALEHPVKQEVPYFKAENLLSTCDFEDPANALCDFHPNMLVAYLWRLVTPSTSPGQSIPDFDHTKQNHFGHYLQVVFDQSNKGNTNDLASFGSKKYPLSEHMCLEFFYYFSGDTESTLIVYKKITDGNKTSLIKAWQPQDEKTQTWQHVFVEIGGSSGQEVEVILEASIGEGNLDSVAVDDVSFYRQQCPPTDKCDFEDSGLCGMMVSPFSYDQWSRSQVASITELNLWGDHTSGLKTGHVLYLATNPNTLGPKHASILTKQYPEGSVKCLSFWYWSRSTSLSIKVRDGRGVLQLVETLTEDTNGFWSYSQYPLRTEEIGKFQIVFQGTTKNVAHSILALDDIKVSHEECDSILNCDFELGTLCSWENVLGQNSNWAAVALLEDRSHIAMLDTGRLAHGEDARLKSQFVDPSNYPACFTFKYRIVGDSTDDFSLHVQLQNGQTESYGYDVHQRNWTQVIVEITHGFFYLTFQGRRVDNKTDSSTGSIEIDNLVLYPGECSAVLPSQQEQVFSCGDTANTMIPSSKVCDFHVDCPDTSADETECADCLFQDGLCNWVDVNIEEGIQGLSTASFETIKKLNSSGTWPYQEIIRDHSGKDSDKFLLIPPSRISANLLLRQELGPSSSSCQITFYYYIDSVQPKNTDADSKLNVLQSRLFLLLKVDGGQTVLWRDEQISSPNWYQAQVVIGQIQERFSLEFQVIVSNPYVASPDIVALDDIQMEFCNVPTEPFIGPCRFFKCQNFGQCLGQRQLCDLVDDCGDGSDEQKCDGRIMDNFEYSLGYWTQDTTDDFDWLIQEGISSNINYGPTRDHTTGLHTGHYLMIEGNGQVGKKARLLSPVLQATGDTPCQMRLFLYMFGAPHVNLTVYQKTSMKGELTSPILENSLQTDWAPRVYDLHSYVNCQVVLEGSIEDWNSMDIGLDDITFSSECKMAANQTLPEGTAPTVVCDKSTQFECVRGKVKCVPLSQVCDFVSQCEDDSDEMYCGSCNFEDHSCGYRDISMGRFAWVRAKASELSNVNAQRDHTRPSKLGEGHYMRVDYGLGTALTSPTMVGPVLPVTGDHCQVVFYLKTNDRKVEIQYGFMSIETPLWPKIYGNSIYGSSPDFKDNEWMEVRMDANHLPPVLQFFVTAYKPVPLFEIDQQYILIDDITFRNCGTSGVASTTQRPTTKGGGATTQKGGATTQGGRATTQGGGATTQGGGATTQGGRVTTDKRQTEQSSLSPGQTGTTVAYKSRSDDSGDSWKVPVGVVLGLLGAAAITVGVLFYLRRTNRLCHGFERFTSYEEGRSNPVYNYASSLHSRDDDIDPQILN